MRTIKYHSFLNELRKFEILNTWCDILRLIIISPNVLFLNRSIPKFNQQSEIKKIESNDMKIT